MKFYKITFKKVYSLLPTFLRQYIIRKLIKVRYENPEENFEVKLAETREELEEAFTILHDCYAKEGFSEPHPSGIRLTVFHALPTTSTIVVKINKKVVGTMTLVRDSHMHLPMEKVWDLSSIRGSANRVAEITCLAIDPKFRRSSQGDVLFPMLKFMYEYCIQYYGVKFLSIVIHPKDIEFYSGLLCFKRLDNLIINDYLGAPAVSMYLDLNDAPEKFKRLYKNSPLSKNLYEYFVHYRCPQFIFPKRLQNFSVDDPVMNVKLLQYFFVEKTAMAEELSHSQLKTLTRHFPKFSNQFACRFAVELEVYMFDKLNSNVYKGFIKDISRTGFRVGESHFCMIDHDRPLHIEVLIPQKPTISFTAVRVWSSPRHGAGFRLESPPPEWLNLVTTLEEQLPDVKTLLRGLKKAA